MAIHSIAQSAVPLLVLMRLGAAVGAGPGEGPRSMVSRIAIDRFVPAVCGIAAGLLGESGVGLCVRVLQSCSASRRWQQLAKRRGKS